MPLLISKESTLKIFQLKLSVSNAFVLLGERPILVDAGGPRDVNAIRSKLRDLHVKFSDLALIVHTHVHSDHMGSTAAIAAEAKCPVAYHPADQPIVDRSHNGQLTGVGLRGRIMSRFFSSAPFAPVQADIDLHQGMNLARYGADATVILTPGHTPGSVSFLTSAGDAIIGDIIMGGYMGGNFLASRPMYHYFADDIAQAMASLDLVLSQTHGTLHVGHGGPLTHASVRQWKKKEDEKKWGRGFV